MASRSKGEQGMGSDRLQGKSRLRLSKNMLFLAGRRAAVPLWPVVCPMPQGGGAVIGLGHADVALGSALDSAEELWHPSPKGLSTRTALLERGYHRGRVTNSDLSNFVDTKKLPKVAFGSF